MLGPRVRIELSCINCDHCIGESCTCQSDSGVDVYCIYPSTADIIGGNSRLIGDSNWSTPSWCPLRQQAIDKLLSELNS